MKKTQVARLLAYVTGMVNQQLLLNNEYLIAENRILRIAFAGPTAIDRYATSDAGHDREAARTSGTAAGRLGRETGDHPGLVSQADCPEV